MNAKNLLQGFVLHFCLVFVVCAAVSFVYSLVAHGHGVPDWRLALQLAISLGIALPIVAELQNRKP